MDRLKSRTFHRGPRHVPPQIDSIEPEEETITIHGPLWKWDWVSKLRDGLLPAVVMLLLVIVPSLIMLPVQNRAGRPGLLVYLLVLLTLGLILLERSLHDDRPIIRRAWYGLAGGMLTWMAADAADRLSGAGLVSLNAVAFFLIIGLVVAILWRRVLPVPARWFMLAIFLNWASRFMVSGEQFIVGIFPETRLVYTVTIALGIAGTLASLFYITWRSRERLARMRAAIVLWFSVLVMLQVLFVEML